MSADYAARRARLRDELVRHGVDAMLVTGMINVRYLTGFTGSNGALLVHAWDSAGLEDQTVIATDARYGTQVADEVPDLRAEITRAVQARLLELCGEWELGRLGFEGHLMTVDQFQALTGRVSGVELVQVPQVVEVLRQVKDATEIAALAAAATAADTALAALLERGAVRPGRTEREIGRELDWLMLEHGAHRTGFETIVAAGVNSAVPHHRPTDAVLAAGDLVVFDFGADVDGYHSDMTRTLAVGRMAGWQRELYELVYAAQAAGLAAARPEAKLSDVDSAARGIIAGAGMADKFLHGLGHGVGLQIHEAPWIGKTADGRLPGGAAVTVEPGVYLSGRGGVRIEDTLIVGSSLANEPQVLTQTSKDLTVI